MTDHIANHIQNPGLVSDNTLHVVVVCSNSPRYHSRFRLARQCIEELESTPNVKVYVVEAAHGDRHHEVTSSTKTNHLQLRTRSEAWIKESMINLGVRNLVPPTAKYIAWNDADIHFRDPNWAQETLHQLQHFAVVQPWEQCADLGPTGNIMQVHESFGRVHQRGARKARAGEDYDVYAHSGYAWACTRAFWEATGGLLDFCILGSADHHMAWAMIGDGDWTVTNKIPASYARRVREWQNRAMRITHGQVGFTPGRIEHAFHGPKNRRYYRERWQILVDNKFDPDTDLMHDAQGLVQLVGKPTLEHDILLYNRSRSEDSIEE